MARRFLAFAIACAWIAGCGGQSSTPTNPVPESAIQLGGPASTLNSRGSNINELPEPPVVNAVNGVAKVSLVAAVNPATGLPTFDYEGMPDVIPTINVKPGETIVVDLADSLPQQLAMAADINLHFHGLGVSPDPPSDDVLGMIARPGQSLHYVVHIPKNQEPGLYWYHPHVHGETSYQVGEGGISGAIVIDGLQHHLPGLAKMKERLIIVRDTGIGANVGPRGGNADMPGMQSMRPQGLNNDPCGPSLGLTMTLNGAYQPIITIAPGEKQFFRVINATGHRTLQLAVDGGKIELVAIDGFALDTYPGTPPTLTESSAVVPPAGRAEFVVTGPRNGSTKFRTQCYDSGPVGDRDPNVVLATLQAPAHYPHRAVVQADRLTVGAPLPQNVYTTHLPPIAARRVVTFSENNRLFFINGKAFSIQAPPMFVVHTGTVEEWRVVNVTQEVHDFHIHQLHFLVEEINGVKVPHPFWADSFVIPHRQANGKSGTLLLLMDFRDPIIKGIFVFHCHILDHEDAGMMAKIEAI
jgi:FtsP/CotA-like multicopper oxidase with cupredoxin domain